MWSSPYWPWLSPAHGGSYKTEEVSALWRTAEQDMLKNTVDWFFKNFIKTIITTPSSKGSQQKGRHTTSNKKIDVFYLQKYMSELSIYKYVQNGLRWRFTAREMVLVSWAEEREQRIKEDGTFKKSRDTGPRCPWLQPLPSNPMMPRAITTGSFGSVYRDELTLLAPKWLLFILPVKF